nr:hypothetical protein [uncultured Deefgea sp.]
MDMDSKLKGAWIVSHAKKIQNTNNQDFDNVSFSGKCGIILSALAGAEQNQLDRKHVDALARAASISPNTELPTILNQLKEKRLVDISGNTIEVLGLATSAVLTHTANIFDESQAESYEHAVIDLADKVSELPQSQSKLIDLIQDTYKLSKKTADGLLYNSKEIGLIDSENIGSDEIIFNGNLFRSGNTKKLAAVIATLKSEEEIKVVELNALIASTGCITLQSAIDIVGKSLFTKLHSIGLYDVNIVGNSSGNYSFVTKPASFSKFTNSFADDALDLAKAFVTSLTYGMTLSNSGRGKIQMISRLMQKMIDGGTVGPATAIGQDYKILELKGVVKVTKSSGSMYSMKLLKPDVGRLALAVINEGAIIQEAVASIPNAQVTSYSGPEINRQTARKDVSGALKSGVASMLDQIRTGKF